MDWWTDEAVMLSMDASVPAGISNLTEEAQNSSLENSPIMKLTPNIKAINNCGAFVQWNDARHVHLETHFTDTYIHN